MSKRPDLSRSDLVAIALEPGIGLGLARGDHQWAIATPDPAVFLREFNEEAAPRWLWWDRATSDLLARSRVPIDRCWDIATVHRLLFGGWRTSVGEIWARLHDLPLETLPQMGQLDLLEMPDDDGDPSNPVQPDGHLRPEWINGTAHTSADDLATWAGLALEAHRLQAPLLDQLPDAVRAHSTARSESAAELLCAEMAQFGLPVNEETANRLIAEFAGPRATSVADEDRIRAERDEKVLVHLTPRQPVNLRNPAEVKAMLRRQGHDLPDTRAWRLEELAEADPLVAALLRWRKAERISTTYGYAWLDEHVHEGRLRGEWTSSDGAAGRMTASAGLHNLPAAMRSIVEADEDHVFVRADLGQVEPRVLAAVSGDPALVSATLGEDLYSPIAARLGVTRDVAKVAVLGAMYGATTGESAHALAGLNTNYPVAMGLLEKAAEFGRRNEDVFTSGGRRVRMWSNNPGDGDLDRAVAAAAARGRYARNAIVQGAAAEFFKVWAITVRRRGRSLAAEVVLCLHDELLVHTPEASAEAVAAMVRDAIGEAAHYWSPTAEVRFSADVSIVKRWSEAK